MNRTGGDKTGSIPSRILADSGKIVIDPITKLPVLSAGDDLPKLTSNQVQQILADFP